MGKKKSEGGGLMYSTNKNLTFQTNQNSESKIPANQQDLRVHLDRLGGGKVVSRIVGFLGPVIELDQLGRLLKQKCGVGGAVKDGIILIQGDHREKILQILLKEGFKAKKAGG